MKIEKKKKKKTYKQNTNRIEWNLKYGDNDDDEKFKGTVT